MKRSLWKTININKHFEKKKVLALIVSLIAIIFILRIGPLDSYTHGCYGKTIDVDNIKAEDFIGQIDLEKEIYKGEFKPIQKHFVGLNLNFTNIHEEDTGTIIVSILDTNNKTLASSNIDLSKMKDQKWYIIYFDVNLKPDTSYYYTIEAKDCMYYPQLQIVNKDYLGAENTGDNILMGYMYAQSTFTFSEKVLLSILIIALWILIIGELNLSQKKRSAINIISLILIMIVGMSWNFMYNSFDNQNTTFSKFQEDSETLVTGMIYAEQNGIKLTKYGLGRYTDYKGSYTSNIMEYINDKNWTYGYSKTKPQIIISNQKYLFDNSIPGNYISFPNGEVFLITDHYIYEKSIVITLDTTGPLDYNKYGSLSKAKFHDSNMKPLPSATLGAYKSQYGLQGKVFRHLARYIKSNNILGNLNFICSFATAIILSLIVILIWKKYNVLMAGCFFVTFMLSPWVVNFARNLYWIEFIWFVPMLAGLFCSLFIHKRSCRILSYVVTFIAILIKCLCGYEYISVIMMGLITFLLVDLIKSIINKESEQAILIFKTIFILGIVAVAGFIIAICIHANLRGNGDLIGGIKDIIDKDVLRRTLGGDMNNFDARLWDSFNSSSWEVFSKYFHFTTGIITGVTGNLFPILCVLPIVILVFNYKNKKIDYTDVLLYIVTFLTSISWYVLGKQHSFVHTHMNYVLWYFGYIQICFYIICKQIINFIYEKNNTTNEFKSI